MSFRWTSQLSLSAAIGLSGAAERLKRPATTLPEKARFLNFSAFVWEDHLMHMHDFIDIACKENMHLA